MTSILLSTLHLSLDHQLDIHNTNNTKALSREVIRAVCQSKKGNRVLLGAMHAIQSLSVEQR
ncbi:hypothetical protein H5410_055190 [Solanum commersonii]|uniref:Uncharacterized protein n=1 Tax=Solanum commersonii TaxID=4109 RepID=A0A9J5WJ75_SOLCO|nr:hypothetical protein H5410_055190 [Solanum commersonii]